MKFTFPPESKPLDGYTIKRAIQRGGFGEVYYALSDGGKEVALKLLQQNLDIELRGVSQCLNLKHPNLLTIFDIKTDGDGDHWIVMEYVSGKNLDEVIDDARGGMSIDDVQSWLDGIAEGLNFLHDRGIVHRDLKPANIYRDHGVVKIGDVGLAKFISESRRSAQTQSVGTVYYMAPEVAHGRYGREVDIYGLGIILYEMLTGRVPFNGESTGEILMKHLSEKPDLSPLPPSLRPVVGRALEKDPVRRTSTAGELADEFRKAAAGSEAAVDIPEDSFVGNTATDTSVADRERRNRKKHAHCGWNHGGWVGKQYRREERKADRQARKLERKAALHARKLERKAALHARRIQKRAVKHAKYAAGYAAGELEKAADRFRQQHAHATVDRPKQKVVVKPAAKEPTWWEENGHVVKIVGIVLLILLIAGGPPGVFASGIFRLGVFVALGYGIYMLVSHFVGCDDKRAEKHRPHSPPPTGEQPREPEAAAAVAVHQRTPQPVQRPMYQHKKPPRRLVSYNPNTRRTIPVRQRMTELTGSMTFAIFATALITVALGFLGILPNPASVGMFGITALAGSWGILASSKLVEGTSVDSGTRRLMQLALGILVGLGAFWLDQTLLVNLWNESWASGSRPDSAFQFVGTHPLLDSFAQPTMAAYILFFAGLFGIRRWWWHADAFRPKRFRVRTALITLLVGAALPVLWAFPLTWGAMWALAISTVVQLSAVWTPPQERPRMRHAEPNRTESV